MTEQWVSFWYQCLSQNMDYGSYCEARRSGNTELCRTLESRFDRVSEIYDDFGELDGWPDDGMNSAQWKQWFLSRSHLFMSAPKRVDDPKQYVPRPGYILLEVPLQGDASTTAEMLKRHVFDCYTEQVVTALPRPKYTLHEKNGRPAHGIRQVQTACISVARSYRYDLETFKQLRHEDAIAAFVRNEIDNMGWSLDRFERKQLIATGKMSEQRQESFKNMLNKCRRDFKAFAANTIRGRFPDNSPFESNVLDIF